MLDYEILNAKSKIKLPTESESMIDLLSKSMVDMPDNILDFGDNLIPCIVEDDYVARPDLISLAFYGTDKYADVICKFNGISNPFELNSGDLIYVPSLGYVTSAVRRAEPSDVITDDADVLIKKYKNQKLKNEKHSQNEQLYGEKNYILDLSKGLIYY